MSMEVVVPVSRIQDSDPRVVYEGQWTKRNYTFFEQDNTVMEYGGEEPGKARIRFLGGIICVYGSTPMADDPSASIAFAVRIDGQLMVDQVISYAGWTNVIEAYRSPELPLRQHTLEVEARQGSGASFALDYFQVEIRNVSAVEADVTVSLDATSQTSGPTTLVEAITFVNSEPTAQSDNTQDTKSRILTGPIVGGVVGVVILVASLILVLFLLRRRRQKKRSKASKGVAPFAMFHSPTRPFPSTFTKAPIEDGQHIRSGSVDLRWASAAIEKSTASSSSAPEPSYQPEPHQIMNAVQTLQMYLQHNAAASSSGNQGSSPEGPPPYEMNSPRRLTVRR
ncbi:hypothetical protein BKA70DRAFT_1219327 [Coprinopsis sp. MPI-PUGE-AT-0042]|nr:hypothetical protein BKA70DRAFT_1219327 [Coprinopsis sp. MPI-PUGE-AT-0042]